MCCIPGEIKQLLFLSVSVITLIGMTRYKTKPDFSQIQLKPTIFLEENRKRGKGGWAGRERRGRGGGRREGEGEIGK